MKKGYTGEDRGESWNLGDTRIRYLNAAEREALRIVVHDGRFYRSNGELFDTNDGRRFRGNGKAIWVMDEYGNLYASTEINSSDFRHSSILGGEAVAGAGDIKIAKGGLV